MAITPAALQTALGNLIGDPKVVRANEVQGADATKQEWYVDGRLTVPGRVRWVSTTASDNAATQAAAVLAALRAWVVPFRSEAQRRFMWMKHPDIARRWTAEYGSKVQPKTAREKVADAMMMKHSAHGAMHGKHMMKGR
jgi:hypothetical protein